jgi:choline kinase
MRALILAAGRGSRLGDAAGGLPKPLLEIGRRPLVEHQLDALAAAGVGPVAMVLGYGADEVRERVGLKAEYVLNAEFATTNSLYSFLLARDRVKGDGLVVLNCDIIFDPRVLDRVLSAGGDAFAYDSGSGDGREHMKVKVADGRLVDMGKDLPSGEAAGENVGLLCFTEATAAALFEKAGALLAQGRRKDFLGAAVREVARERPMKAVDVAGLPWGEIDFPYDLDRARKEVWPAIERGARRRRPSRRVARWAAAALAAAALGVGIWRMAPATQATALTPLDVQGASETTVQTPSGSHRWNLLGTSQTATVSGVGPGQVHVESRLLANGQPGAPAPYVLEVSIDGRRVDWFKLTSRPSRTARHQGNVVGKSRTITLDLPNGAREVGVKLVAADSGKCLIRVHGVEQDEDGPDEAPAGEDAEDVVKTSVSDR